jgi:hypothetical protein
MRELNLLKLKLGTVLIEANTEILLDVSFRGASGELRPRKLSNPSIATDHPRSSTKPVRWIRSFSSYEEGVY